jgi:hypothetical protein
MPLSSKHVLESCQELLQQPNSTASTTGYCISYLNDQLIAVGCSNGCIQLLDAVKLTQIAILPTTPPLGHANITNIQVIYYSFIVLHQSTLITANKRTVCTYAYLAINVCAPQYTV